MKAQQHQEIGMDIWRKALKKKLELDIWDLGKTGGMWHNVMYVCMAIKQKQPV